MGIQVSKYIPCAKEGSNVVAIVSFYIPEWNLHLHQSTYIRSPKGGFFVGFPSRKFTKDGKDYYNKYYDFEGSTKERFQSAAKKAIDEYIEKNNQQPPTKQENEQPEFDLF